MDRRSFIKRGAATGAAAFIGTSLLGREVMAGAISKDADIAVVNGTDSFENTKKAVDVLGGMGKFVPKGSKVGLLVNAGFDQKGAYVDPDITLSVMKMCFEAGADEVLSVQDIHDVYWERSPRYEEMKDMLGKLSQVESNDFPAEFNEEDWKTLPGIEGAVSLKDVEVVKAMDEVDVLINIFIAKHHAGSMYTGALKNTMGF